MGPGQINGQAVRNQLEQVLSSAGFARNARLSGFLRFLVERASGGFELHWGMNNASPRRNGCDGLSD